MTQPQSPQAEQAQVEPKFLMANQQRMIKDLESALSQVNENRVYMASMLEQKDEQLTSMVQMVSKLKAALTPEQLADIESDDNPDS